MPLPRPLVSIVCNPLKNISWYTLSRCETPYVNEYGHEAKPSILGLQIVFLAARRDYGDGGGGDYRVRQEL